MKGEKRLIHQNLVFLILLFICVVVLCARIERDSLVVKGTSSFLHSVPKWISDVTHWFAKVKDFAQLFEAQEENRRLKEQINDFWGLERRMLSLQEENQRLRALLNFPKHPEYETLCAEIIARDFNDFFGTILINRGSTDGIQKNMVVIAYNPKQQLYGLVGCIQEVYTHTSSLRLVFHKQFHIGAKTEKSNIVGLFDGEGDPVHYGKLNYVNVNNKADLMVDDLIVTNGVDSPSLSILERQLFYPRNIYIGRIEAIDTISYQASLQIEVAPIVNFASLEYVFVITNLSESGVGL